MKVWSIRVATLLVGFLGAGSGQAQQTDIRLIPDASIRFEARPGAPGLAASDIHGSVKQKGLYTVQVKFSKGGKAPPHTHPDERILNVLSDTIHFGAGTVFDESALRPLNAGSVVIIPPDTPHFVWAKGGEAIVQESGFGPSGTIPWPKGATRIPQ